MKVSLIIPIYEQAENLKIILSSIYNQIGIKSEEFEIIIVDDGSRQEIKDVLLDYRDLNIVYIRHKENLGRSAVRNTGAKAATGEILVFTDGDRFLSPKFLSKHYEFHKVHKNSVLIGDIAEVFVKDTKTYLNNITDMFRDKNNIMWRFTRSYNYAEQVLKIYDKDGKTESSVPWLTLFSGNFSIRKSSFDLVKGFDESYKKWGYENIDFGYRLYIEGIKYFYEKEAVNFHIYHVQKRFIDREEEFFMLKKKFSDKPEFQLFIQFLNGQVALSQIEKVKDKKVNTKEKEIFYHKNKLGLKYEPKVYKI